MNGSESVRPSIAAPAQGWEWALRAYQRGQPDAARDALEPLRSQLPIDDETLYLAGLIEAQAGCWDAAADLLAQAAARAPERIGPWLALASVRRTLGQHRAAAEALREALRREPRHAPALNDLGTAYHELGLYREALDCHDRARQIAPDFRDALRSRPRLLARLHRTEAAHEAYLDLLARWPDDPALRLEYAEFLERGHESDAAEAQLEEVGRPANTAVCARAQALRGRLMTRRGDAQAALELITATRRATGANWLSYQEGALLHDAGRPAAAMRAFRRANAARAREWRFRRMSRHDLPGTLARKIEVGLSADPAMPPPDEQGAPVFLLGLPRSGTTLLDRMIAAHPAIQVVEEPVSLQWTEEVLEHTGSPEQARAAYWAHVGGLALDERPVVVDKNPLHTEHLDVLARVFPDALVIVLMRHPYDAALSCFMQDFDPNPASRRFLDLEATGALCRQLLTLIRAYERSFPERAVRVHYERLVADYRNEVGRVLAGIGCSWDPAIEAFAARTGFVTTPSYQQVTRGIYDSSIGRWSDYAPWIGPLRQSLGDMLAEFGYADTDAPAR